ncbi:ABC transporter permease [Pelobacter propionicus]|uniref:Transport permease protein n=1 Tax=Pelobacter propionicus (strain DSM 2379 / NBRC 103807 / OttBd1) TaxID=338966 RepID=A1AT34_PELPD|nr:ABC transporter permease [Pelobacter propionicus]ABL00505.1 ABC-2 type transporter [Pelobacter propionicus DSM 2379]
MLERLRAMLIKEFIQVFRDPRMRIVLFVLPALQTVIFGYAVDMDVKNIPTAIMDRDNSSESRELTDIISSSGHFRITRRIDNDSQARNLLDRGTVRVVLTIEHGFSQQLARGENVTVQALMDGSDSNTAGVVMGYLGRFSNDYNSRLQLRFIQRHQGGTLRTGRVELASRAWFNENLESPPFYVPAVITNILFVITMLLSSLAIVREKEIGTMEQVIVTPIRKREFILGKTLPFVLIGYIDVALISLVGTLVFHVPVRGSLGLLFLATTLFLMSALGIGLLISTVSRTQQQAMMSAFFVIFPAMLLSGFAFPIENMPLAVQWLTLANPLRYYMVIVRGIFLKGVGLTILWPHMAALTVIGLAVLLVAVERFRKTIA